MDKGQTTKKAATKGGGPTAKKSKGPSKTAKPVLLSGGNPQIAKADGDDPVQAYIAAMPGWKSEIGRRLDALVVRTVPGVHKAIKWNSPFYGIAGQGWFLSFHTFTGYVKVTFFQGTSLRPTPSVEAQVRQRCHALPPLLAELLDAPRLAELLDSFYLGQRDELCGPVFLAWVSAEFVATTLPRLSTRAAGLSD